MSTETCSNPAAGFVWSTHKLNTAIENVKIWLRERARTRVARHRRQPADVRPDATRRCARASGARLCCAAHDVGPPRRLRSVIADAHVDLLLELGSRELRFGETNTFARTWLPLLEAGGVGLQVCPVFVELERQPEGTLREALGQATCLLRAVRENPDRVLQVRSAADLDAVERGERLGLMLSLEGVEQFGYEIWPAETFFELGMRMAGLTWNRRNPFSDGAIEDGGLSRLGRALVDELVEPRGDRRSRPRLGARLRRDHRAGRRRAPHLLARSVSGRPRPPTQPDRRSARARSPTPMGSSG